MRAICVLMVSIPIMPKTGSNEEKKVRKQTLLSRMAATENNADDDETQTKQSLKIVRL